MEKNKRFRIKNLSDNKLEKKIGKTSTSVKLIRDFDDQGNPIDNGVRSLILGFEMGWSGLNNVKAVPLNDWLVFKQKVVKPLVQKAKEVKSGKITRDQFPYNSLIFDTADLCYTACEKFILSNMGINSTDEDVNSYKKIEREFEQTILELARLTDAEGRNLLSLIFLTHDEIKQQKNLLTREKEIFVSTSLDKRCQKVLSRMVDFTIFMKTVDTGEGIPQRYAFFRTDGTIECGTRYRHIVPYCQLNPLAIEKAVLDAIDKQCEEDGIVPVIHTQNYIPNEVEYDFEKLMVEARELYGIFEKNNQLTLFVDIVEKVLGLGRKLSDLKPSQAQSLSAVNNDLKEKATELGLM